MDNIKISLFFNDFFGSIRVTLFGDVMDDVICFGIKPFKICMVRDADCVESLAGYSDR